MNSTDDLDDAVWSGLASLGEHDVPPARAKRVLALCRAELQRRARRRDGASSAFRQWAGLVEPAAALGLGACLLAAALVRALVLFG